MIRFISLFISFFLGRVLHTGDQVRTSEFIKLPMLMLRKVSQLWLIGLGVLLIGVVGVALLLLEVSQQLQLQHYVAFTSSMGVMTLVIALSVGCCALMFKKSNWTSNDESDKPSLKDAPTSGATELSSVLALLAKDFLDERIRQRTEAAQTPLPSVNGAGIRSAPAATRPAQASGTH